MDELERLGLDDKFGLVYDNEIMQKKMINTARNWGYDDGKADGLEEGAKAKEIEIAKNLLNIGTPKEDIIKVTGLSEDEINNLLEKLKKEA